MLLLPEAKPTNVQAKEKKFLGMENLRLIIGNVPFHGHLEFLPNGFRQLDWDKYPFSSWSKFCPKKLVVLNMYLNISVGPFNLVRSLIVFIYKLLYIFKVFYFLIYISLKISPKKKKKKKIL